MRIFTILLILVGIAVGAEARGVGESVEVLIRTDTGRILPLYPVDRHGRNRRAYVEAVKGENYAIIVRNRLGRRIGVVLAVDGRNIISGGKSWLRGSERMYILDPYQEGEFAGWRTGREQINRFYFTRAADSYAAAFHDESAMGVIAVAVYPEALRCDSPLDISREKDAARAAPAPSAGARSESAGTGFGREEFSPVRIVEFEPEGEAVEKVFLKYEWRSTLCRKGIVDCGRERQNWNRMWEDDGFAPPPPGR